MSDPVITDVSQVDLTWLNRVLARCGALPTGGSEPAEAPPPSARVIAFEAEAPATNTWSRSTRIRLTYESGSPASLPTQLFLKICTDDDDTFGPSEVHYYTRDYIDLADPPFPKCYDARYATGPRRYHILMADLSETHTHSFETPLSEGYGRAVAEALATLHAHWWATGARGAAGLALPGDADLARYIDHIRPGLEPMLDHAAGEIEASWRDTLQEVFEKHPPLMRERATRREGFTLVHGDVNPGNVLSPREGHRPVYLLDRQPFDWSLTTWLGVSDLTCMFVHRWEPEQRRALEIPILRHYHKSLRRHGVTSYPWEDLLRDYRLCSVQNLYVPTEWCLLEEDRTRMRWLWLSQLQRSIDAFHDLRCDLLWA